MLTRDIIHQYLPSYLSQDRQKALADALNGFPNKFNYYASNNSEELLQGDGCSKFEIINFETSNKKTIKGIILSNSCDISTDNKRDIPAKITFAPLLNLDKFKYLLSQSINDQSVIDQKIEAIKNQKVTSMFFLPKNCDLESDTIALLDDLHTIPLKSFIEKNNKDKIFELSQVGFYLFLLKLSIHFCRFHEGVERGL